MCGPTLRPSSFTKWSYFYKYFSIAFAILPGGAGGLALELYGDLKKYAPGEQGHFTLTLKPGATLGEVFQNLSMPEGRQVSLINGRRAIPETRFKDGDTLVLFPPISGG
jgi:molybdopterin converting factor small subunit